MHERIRDGEDVLFLLGLLLGKLELFLDEICNLGGSHGLTWLIRWNN